MTKIAGKEITKNTVVGASIGTIVLVIMSLWTILGIGRPLFASDLKVIEKKIDAHQVTIAVQILSIRKDALQSDLRTAERDVRHNPTDDAAADDVSDIKSDIKEIEKKIDCHRTKGCEVEREI